MNHQEQAKAFRLAFDQPIISPMTEDGCMDLQTHVLQTRLVKEESIEFLEAADGLFSEPDVMELREHLLKEAADLVFVVYQYCAAFEFDLSEALDRVYDSNMSKLGEDGKPIYREDGKVLKSSNYAPPNLSDLVPPLVPPAN